jgi:large subunit ribosomal protein L32
MPQLAICKTTGEAHVFHHAYWHEGNMYYKGKMVLKGKVKKAVESSDDSQD